MKLNKDNPHIKALTDLFWKRQKKAEASNDTELLTKLKKEQQYLNILDNSEVNNNGE